MTTADRPETLSDLEAAAYARAISSGRSKKYALAFSIAFAAAYRVGLSDGVETGFLNGFERGRTAERARIRSLMASNAAQSADAQRWLLSLALETPVEDDVETASADHPQ